MDQSSIDRANVLLTQAAGWTLLARNNISSEFIQQICADEELVEGEDEIDGLVACFVQKTPCILECVTMRGVIVMTRSSCADPWEVEVLDDL